MTISVVMCTYNAVPFVHEQIESILAQSCPPDEVIIQDDGSTDGTVDILMEYAANNPRISVQINDNHRGVNQNFITAIDKAKGDLIAWSDQDDIWHKDKLKLEKEYIIDNDLWLCTHPSHSFWGNKVPSFETIEVDRRIPNLGIERTLFLGCIPGHTMLFRRVLRDIFRSKVPEEVLASISNSFIYDTMLSIVANAYGKVGFISQPLVLHRRLTSSVTFSDKKVQESTTRSVSNAMKHIANSLKYRNKVQPKIDARFDSMKHLLLCFPDVAYSSNAIDLISAYQSKLRFIKFPYQLILNRDRIFFSKEDNEFVAVIHSLYFNLVYYQYFKK